MNRRTFLHYGGVGMTGYGLGLTPYTALPGDQMLLSEQGCGRATGYAEANKIVSFAGKTHVTWLDSVGDKFYVRIRTIDRRNGQWSEIITVGEAADNHGGAALSIDSRGHLHLVYHPHHHPMRYRRSTRPNDATEWGPEITFGTRCTYPTLICGPDDTLYLSCRHSREDQFWQVRWWSKQVAGAWQDHGAILEARFQGYAHFQESLAWGANQRTLFLCCRIHERTENGQYGRLQTVGFMKSTDYGRTWMKSDDTPVLLPASATSLEILAEGGLDYKRVLRAGGMAVDAGNRPHLVYSLQENGAGSSFLAFPEAQPGAWRQIRLNDFLPDHLRKKHLIMPGGISFNKEQGMFIVAQVQEPDLEDRSWGHASTEVVLLHSKDGGGAFQCREISSPDPAVANWLPNIERPTGYNQISTTPAVIYTSGAPGRTNSDSLANGVYFVD